jgi:Zn-dependent protease
MEIIYLITSLLFAISFHEAAHAYTAYRFGDSTAKTEGRLTLNPLAHLDPIGTLALIFIHIGWGKPVPVNPYNLKNPARDNFLIALAGPITNIILALIAALLFRLTFQIPYLGDFFYTFITLNVILAIFNILPIPPLDGSKIWHLLLSNEAYYQLERMGPFILIAVLIFSYSTGNILFNFISQIVNLLVGIVT